MEKTYRLEFNEKQQKFHLTETPEGNTHEWVTIFEHCTNLEFEVYKAYINRIPQEKYTEEYLLKCASEIHVFMLNLVEANLHVGRFC
jgi:hypothetical protein